MPCRPGMAVIEHPCTEWFNEFKPKTLKEHFFQRGLLDVTSQWFATYMKVIPCTGAVVISLHCKHNMFTYISVSHKHAAKHCIISQFHTNIKATAPY